MNKTSILSSELPEEDPGITPYDHTLLEFDFAARNREFARMRRDDPVVWDANAELWYVTRHVDVRQVLTDPRTYSSAEGVVYCVQGDLSFIAMDDPEHARQRRVTSHAFTPRMIRGLQPRLVEYADRCIDRLLEVGRGDFVSIVAQPVPLMVIMDILGMSHDRYAELLRWTDDMLDYSGREEDDALAEKAAIAFDEWGEYLEALVAYRARESGDDIVSILANLDADSLEEGDAPLTPDELQMFCGLLMVAGNETTRHTISRGLYALLQHPEQWNKLKKDPSLLRTAADEILRWTSVQRGTMRTVTHDTVLAGKTLRRDERVITLFPSANRDEDAFDQADSFRIDRVDNPHLAFGMGPHFCMGAHLARIEIAVVFGRILERIPNIRLTAEPDFRSNSLVDGVRSMMVEVN